MSKTKITSIRIPSDLKAKVKAKAGEKTLSKLIFELLETYLKT